MQFTPNHVHGLALLSQFVELSHPVPFVELYRSTKADRSEQPAAWLVQFVIQLYDHVPDLTANRVENPWGMVPHS